MPRRALTAGVISGLLVVPLGLVLPAASAAAGCSSTSPVLGVTVTCTSAGSETITVPEGATAVRIVAVGGGGSGGGGTQGVTGGAGGKGAQVTATTTLGAATALSIVVGAGGAAGYYGGWGGTFSSVAAGSDLLVVAGGGGGGAFCGTGSPGAGGDGAAANTPAGGDGGDAPVGANNEGHGGNAGVGGAAGPPDAAPFTGKDWSAGGAGGFGYGSAGGDGGSGYGGGGGGGNHTGGSQHPGGGAGGSYASVGTATYAPSTSLTAGLGGAGGIPGAGGSSAPGSSGTDGLVQITFYGTPTIASVTPATGPVLGGTSIYVDGTNLTGATAVTFGATAGTITNVTDTRVTVLTPSGFGQVDVVATAPGGTATSTGAFTYNSPTISSATPNTGTADGGLSVYVDGTNLTFTTSVTFGGVAGTITNVSNTRVTVLTPVSAVSGAVNVVVSAQGPASATSVGAFTYTAVAPGPPSAVTAVAGEQSAAVSWTPGANGGQTISSYTVTSSPDARTCSTASTSCTVTGLAAGTSYTFTVRATNATGTSPASSLSNSVVPSAPNSGGGGGSGGGGATTDPVLPVPTPTASTPSPAAAPSGAATVAPAAPRTAVIAGFTPPRTIAPRGTTVLVEHALRTTDGVRVTAQARVRAAKNVRQVDQVPSIGAKIVRGKAGRISVVTTGRAAVVVTLQLTAPPTSTTAALHQVYSWRVPWPR